MALTPSDVFIPSGWFPVDIQNWMVWRPPQHVLDILGLVGVVALIYLIAWLFNRPRSFKMGEDQIVRDIRNLRVKYIVAEGITEFVEEAVFKDKLTRSEAMDIYTKFGKMFSIVDLLPKRKIRPKIPRGQVEHLKELIRERLAAAEKEEAKVVALPKKRVGEFLKR